MKKFWLMIGGLVAILAVLLFYCLTSLGDGLLHVFVLNIGQGDAILIQTPGLERVLIDGGPDDKILRELADVMPFYERTIDVIVLSHPHADHVNGLVEVLKRYDVQQIVITGVSYNYPGYRAFLDLAAQKKISILLVNGQQDFQLLNDRRRLKRDGIIFDILFPFESLQGRTFENLNNSSISFRLLYREKIFYFSGDLEIEGEKKLVASGLDLQADVLKAGHHGSRTSSSEPFLNLVRPKVALISCGVKNKFKHPHPETIQHFQEHGIQIFRTDINGRIEVLSDGKSIHIKPS